jgi:hypothetical protein
MDEIKRKNCWKYFLKECKGIANPLFKKDLFRFC